MKNKITNLNFRTDMADERVDTYKKVHNLTNIDGIKVTSSKDDIVSTTIVEVLNENGEKAVSKKIGKYITMQIKELSYMEDGEKERISKIIADKLKELIGDDISKSILVVGLGNIYVTPDSLGPKVATEVEITRHLLHYAKELVTTRTREISAISPGVLGTTGIETAEIVSAISKKIEADMVIVIDSLASQSIDRIGTTIQISNTGITPGAGVRNKREGINKDTLGVPVIAIGVPTVVNLKTIMDEGINEFIGDLQDKAQSNEYLNELKEKGEFNISDDDNHPYNNMIVTPKEIDDLIENMKDVIARGINYAV